MRISDWSSDVCSSDLISPASWFDCDASPLPLKSLPPPMPISLGEKKDSGPVVGGVRPKLESRWVPEALLFDAMVRSTSRSEEHTSELQSLMRISYAVFCLKKKKNKITQLLIINKTNTRIRS